MRPFLWRHAEDDGLYVLESIIVDVEVLDGLAHTWYHANQVLDAAHLLDLLYLFVEVVEVKLILLDLLLQAACLLLVVLLLSPFDERNDIAHTEDAVCHTAWVERVERFHLLACADELDGLIDDASDAERSTTSGIAIKLGENNTRIVQPIIELLCRIDGVLTGHSVHDEEYLVRLSGITDVLYLLHQFLVDSLTTCRIDDEHVESLSFCMLNGILGNKYWICCAFFEMNGNAHLLAQHTQLFHSSRAESVASGKQRILPSLFLEQLRQLTAHRGFTCTVQASHEDDGRMAFEVHVGRLTAHQFCQLIVHDFHHQLLGLDGCQNVLAKCFLLNSIGESLCHLVVDVGIEQGTTHILQRLGDVDLGYLTFTFQYLERPFQPFA